MRRLAYSDYAVDAVTAAKALVGAWLCRRMEDGSIIRRRITETEAYCGEEDTACHAHKGRTARTDVMYSAGGCAYIYLCYGIHEMLNVVTGPEGHPEAVLIRGVEGAEGPGRLTKLLKIDRSLNREDLVASNRLWLESDGARVEFAASARIGIGYASQRDQRRKWRFTLLIGDIRQTKGAVPARHFHAAAHTASRTPGADLKTGGKNSPSILSIMSKGKPVGNDMDDFANKSQAWAAARKGH